MTLSPTLILIILAWAWMIPWVFFYAPILPFYTIRTIEPNDMVVPDDYVFENILETCPVAPLLEIENIGPHKMFEYRKTDKKPERLEICLSVRSRFPDGPVDFDRITDAVLSEEKDFQVKIKNKIAIPEYTVLFPLKLDYDRYYMIGAKISENHLTKQTLGYWHDTGSPIFIFARHTSLSEFDTQKEVELLKSIHIYNEPRFGFPNFLFFSWLVKSAGVIFLIVVSIKGKYLTKFDPEKITANNRYEKCTKILLTGYGIEYVFVFMDYLGYFVNNSWLDSPPITWALVISLPLQLMTLYLFPSSTKSSQDDEHRSLNYS